MPSEVLRDDSKLVDVEVHPLLPPVREPLLVGTWLAEELHLHLLELAGAEYEVLGCDLVSEALSNLCDSKWNLHTGGLYDVLELSVDSLCCLRSEIDCGCCIHIRSNVGGEHEVEVPWRCERTLASTHRAWSVEVYLIRSETALALLAVNHWVSEVAHVSACLPYPWVHENGSIKSNYAVMELGHLLPPQIPYVVLELYSKWTIVVGAVEASVDLTALEYESSSSAKRNYLVHCYFRHSSLPLFPKLLLHVLYVCTTPFLQGDGCS